MPFPLVGLCPWRSGRPRKWEKIELEKMLYFATKIVPTGSQTHVYMDRGGGQVVRALDFCSGSLSLILDSG